MNVTDWLFHASIEDWELRLIYYAAIPQTLFVLGYGLLNRWWTSLIGQGLLTKALALALLLDLTVAQDLFGDYPYRRRITLAIVILIAFGSTMQFAAWVLEKRRRHRYGGDDRYTDTPAHT